MLRLRPNRIGIALWLAVLVLGLGFLYLGEKFARNVRKLDRTAVVVEADVHSWQVRTQRGSTYHQVRYSFTVPGHAERYTAGEPETGRTDLWVSLDEDDFERSRETRRVAIRYSADDPWLNQPVNVAGNKWGNAYAIWFLAATCLLTFFGIAIAGVMQYSRHRRHPVRRVYLLFEANPDDEPADE